jgi:hypothetical protein
MRHVKRPSLPNQAPLTPHRGVALAMCAFALMAPACTGSVEGDPAGVGGSGVGKGGGGGAPPTTAGTAGTPGTGTGGSGTAGTGGMVTVDPSIPCAPGSDSRLVVAPQRTLRLTARQYVNSVRAVINQAAADKLSQVEALSVRLAPVVRKFPPLIGEADNIIGKEYTELDVFAGEVAKYVLENFSAATACTSPATDACATAWLKGRAALAYRRPLTEAEDSRLTGLYTKLKSQEVNGYLVTNTVEQATSEAINALFSSPQFLWRWEMGNMQAPVASTSPPGVYLTDQELASNLSFFLTDGPPDQMLISAASANDGSLRANLQTHVERLLGQQVTKDWLTTAIETNYGLNQLPDLPIDNTLFPIWNTELLTGMLDEANLFLKNILFTGQLTDLFLSRTTFLNPLLATEIYKVPVPAGATSTNYVQATLPSDQRAGILTNAAFVTARGRSNGLGLVVPRGRMVTAAILCMPPDPPPPEIGEIIEAQKATQATTTAQEQVASRKAGLCGTCHAQIDPYGLVMDYYDNLARYRTTDHLNKPVDGRTTLPPALGGGEVTSAVDLAEKLAASPEFTNCMARTVLQYALVDFTAPVEVPLAGKTAGCAVIDVVDKYKSASGKTFSDLIRATTATPAFAIRKTTP